MGHDSAHAEGGHVAAFERARLAMWLFLASEIMMFGAFIGSYVVLRFSMTQTPEGLAVFDWSQGQLSWKIACINTAVLILSSYTMVRAVNAISKGNRAHCEDMVIATAALGALFLVIKLVFEYAVKFDHNIYPSTNVFFSCYYLMTGFHGIHVLVGVILLVWTSFYIKKYGPTNYGIVENLALYWHLVDLVWIFLFPIVYLL